MTRRRTVGSRCEPRSVASPGNQEPLTSTVKTQGTMSSAKLSSINGSLAGAFSRLGWIGFWLQLAIGAIPVALLIYGFLFGGNDGIGTRGRFALIEYLTLASLLVLAFTTIWFYR